MTDKAVIVLMVVLGLVAVGGVAYYIVIPIMRVVLNFLFPCQFDIGWNPFC